MAIMFEATKGNLKIAFSAVLISGNTRLNTAFPSDNDCVEIYIEPNFHLYPTRNNTEEWVVRLKTNYNDFMRHAEEQKGKNPLGIVNIDKFKPTFSW